MDTWVWRMILDSIRTRYSSLGIETRANIKVAFAGDIAALRETILTQPPDSPEYEAALSPYLERWQTDVTQYVPRLLRVGGSIHNRKVVVFVDNVDQLPPAYQAKIYLFAQHLTRTIPAITTVALREESYYTASTQKTFTAYSSRKFHIESPRFRQMIGSRIRFALRSLAAGPSETDVVLRSGITIDRAAVAAFLRIVEYSVFQRNRNIARFIETVCFGNMRMALEMFRLFLESGATDVDKMLRIYQARGAYFVPFHEFLKSVMLGERHYYRESRSRIMNLFDCGVEKNASHFTSLRVLAVLLDMQGAATSEGPGYLEIGRVLRAFEDVFDNSEDVIRCMNRMVQWQLIEVNTRSASDIVGASHARATSAGWYYKTYLCRSFPYLDLVLQDTPLNDSEVEWQLRHSVIEVDNLSGGDADKVRRLEVRFERVRTFLDYLVREEHGELSRVGLVRPHGLLDDEIVPAIRNQVEKEMAFIHRRITGDREPVAEDVELDVPSDAEREPPGDLADETID